MPPRPSIVALAAFIAISFILILHQFSASSSYYRDAFTRSRSLTAWLNNEEEHYSAFLEGRQQLIRKWGPSESAVQPWVPPAILFTFLTRPCAHVDTSSAFCGVTAPLRIIPFKSWPPNPKLYTLCTYAWFDAYSVVNLSLCQGTFSSPPSNAHIELSVSARSVMVASGPCGVDRVCWQDKMRHLLFRSVFFLNVFHRRRVDPLACVI